MRGGQLHANIDLKPNDFALVVNALMENLETGKAMTPCGPLRVTMLKKGVADTGETCVIRATLQLSPNERTAGLMSHINPQAREDGDKELAIHVFTTSCRRYSSDQINHKNDTISDV